MIRGILRISRFNFAAGILKNGKVTEQNLVMSVLGTLWFITV